MSPDEIENIMRTIRNNNVSYEEKKVLYAKEFSEFVKNYPVLFDAMCNNEFSLTFLDLMLNEIRKLDSAEINTDQANKKVFTTLNKTYVDPLLEEPNH